MQSGGNATRDSYKYPNSMKMASVGSLHCSYECVHTLVPCPVQSSVYIDLIQCLLSPDGPTTAGCSSAVSDSIDNKPLQCSYFQSFILAYTIPRFSQC